MNRIIHLNRIIQCSVHLKCSRLASTSRDGLAQVADEEPRLDGSANFFGTRKTGLMTGQLAVEFWRFVPAGFSRSSGRNRSNSNFS